MYHVAGNTNERGVSDQRWWCSVLSSNARRRFNLHRRGKDKCQVLLISYENRGKHRNSQYKQERVRHVVQKLTSIKLRSCDNERQLTLLTTGIQKATYQQAVCSVHSDAPWEAVMNGQAIHKGCVSVPSLVINVPTQVEMDGIPPQVLLTHVSQFHVRKMHRSKIFHYL